MESVKISQISVICVLSYVMLLLKSVIRGLNGTQMTEIGRIIAENETCEDSPNQRYLHAILCDAIIEICYPRAKWNADDADRADNR